MNLLPSCGKLRFDSFLMLHTAKKPVPVHNFKVTESCVLLCVTDPNPYFDTGTDSNRKPDKHCPEDPAGHAPGQYDHNCDVPPLCGIWARVTAKDTLYCTNTQDPD